MYTHICRNCENSFEGRKNKVYCSQKCKTTFNNNKLEERNRYFDLTISEVKRNREILRKIHEVFGSALLPKFILAHTRLNFGCTTGLSKNGQTFFGDFEIRAYQNSSIRIIKHTHK